VLTDPLLQKGAILPMESGVADKVL